MNDFDEHEVTDWKDEAAAQRLPLPLIERGIDWEDYRLGVKDHLARR